MADITLQDVRSKYPQYKDMSDQQLVEGLHKKFYADMPMEEFSKKVGYTPPTKVDTPVSEPFSSQKIGAEAYRGLTTGGPLMGLATGAEEAVSQWNKYLPGLAYKAGEKVTTGLAKRGVSPDIAAGAGFATNIGLQAVPVVASGIPAKAAAPVLRHEAETLMQSAIKPILSDLKKGKAAEAIDTMLEEGITVGKGGMQKLRGKIDNLNTQIEQKIKESSADVKTSRVARALVEKLKEFKMQVNPEADINALKESWSEFKRHPLLGGRKEIPVELAQQLKTGTYRQLGSKAYGELKSSTVEAQKQIARGLKEGIAEQVPAIADLNKKESKMLNALNVVERRVLLDANKNPMGLSLLAKDPSHMATFMADRSPYFKSVIARILNAGKEQIPATAARVGVATAQGMGQYHPNQYEPIPPKQ